jgi:hypothetical protein
VYQDGTTATAGGWRSAAAWLGVLVLACGRPDDGQGSSLPRPRPEPAPEVAAVWARDPATDECGYYADRDAGLNGWLRFDSYIECRCSIESCPSTLEEAGARLCAVTSPPPNVQLFMGCGVVAVVDYSGAHWTFEQPSASGGSATPALRLVGAAKYSDASSFDAGSTSSWMAGIDPTYCNCGPSSVCALCGEEAAAGFPPCQ